MQSKRPNPFDSATEGKIVEWYTEDDLTIPMINKRLRLQGRKFYEHAVRDVLAKHNVKIMNGPR